MTRVQLPAPGQVQLLFLQVLLLLAALVELAWSMTRDTGPQSKHLGCPESWRKIALYNAWTARWGPASLPKHWPSKSTQLRLIALVPICLQTGLVIQGLKLPTQVLRKEVWSAKWDIACIMCFAARTAFGTHCRISATLITTRPEACMDHHGS